MSVVLLLMGCMGWQLVAEIPPVAHMHHEEGHMKWCSVVVALSGAHLCLGGARTEWLLVAHMPPVAHIPIGVGHRHRVPVEQ